MKTKYWLLLAAALAGNASAQFIDPQITRDAANCASGGPCELMEQVQREEEERKAYWARQQQLAEEQEREKKAQERREREQAQQRSAGAVQAPSLQKPAVAKPAGKSQKTQGANGQARVQQ